MILYSNNASTTLASGISNSDTTIVVATGTGSLFPTISSVDDYFNVTIADSAKHIEIVTVTARTGDTFTVMRGMENTTARSWLASDILELRITKGLLDQLKLDATKDTASNLSAHTSNTSNPHSVTATQVGLGNVTNESKATMFTNPTFTGNAVLGSPASGNFSTGTFTWPTFNQNTTGTANNITAYTINQNVGTSNSPSFSGLTLSGGTANGVLYLNGSKVATSGSALTFDGTNLGIGTASPSYKLDVTGAANAWAGHFFGSSTSGQSYGVGIDAGTNSSDTAFQIRNYAGSATYLKVTGDGNLGIGVTPSAWITGYRAIQMPGGSIESHAGYIGMWGNCYLNSSAQYTYVSDGPASRYIQNSGYHFWYTAPSGTAGNAITFTEQMRLTSSGNLLVGKTTDDGVNKLQVNGSTTTSSLIAGWVAYPAVLKQAVAGMYGSSLYLSNDAGAAQSGCRISGVYGPYNGGSGATALVFETASNTQTYGGDPSSLTYTERMRLDSSGNLGLGVTPSAWGSTWPTIQVKNASFTGTGALNDFAAMGANLVATRSSYPTDSSVKYISNGYATSYRQLFGAHQWYTAPSGTAGNTISFTEVMTLDSSGNLQVGGTESAVHHMFVGADDGKWATYIKAKGSANVRGLLVGAPTASTSDNGSFLIYGESSGTSVLQITASGNMYNRNGVYASISDQKLKENIVDASPKLDDLCKVKVRNFNLIDDENKLKQIGVVAQEIEEVFPSMVDETPDYEELIKTREVEVPAVLDEDGNEVEPATTKTEEYSERVATGTTTKSVKYSVFVPMLIKAVQEQQAIIESLTQRIEALEYTKQGE